MEYAKQLVNSCEDPEPDMPMDEDGTPDRCVCNVCVDMGNNEEDEENKCCRNRSCVASYEMFRNIVLDKEVLTIGIRARCDIRAEDAEFEMNSYRKAVYRQYILYKYGKSGKGNRRVCPSCVIRFTFS